MKTAEPAKIKLMIEGACPYCGTVLNICDLDEYKEFYDEDINSISEDTNVDWEFLCPNCNDKFAVELVRRFWV